jgi:hypothetical protein
VANVKESFEVARLFENQDKNQLFCTGLNKYLLGLTNLVLTAYMTIAAVLLTPNLAMIFLRWVLIVCCDK